MLDPSQVEQLRAKLCVNARDAIKDTGKRTVETGNVTFDARYCESPPGFFPGDYVLLAVSDDGCGMEKETIQQIFEPFFTTKDVGRGTGLGLATVYGIVKQTGGFINVYSEPGQGTTFKIYFARHHKSETVAPKQQSGSIPLGRGETILIVEDDGAILRLTKRMLQGLGYEVISADNPLAALLLSEKIETTIDLLLTDVIMPEMNGKELAGRLEERWPGLLTLFMSGYTANTIAHHGVLDEGVNFLQKPFSQEIMAMKVREVLEQKKSG